MPALHKKLQDEIAKNPTRKSAYDRNIAKAREVAGSMPLIHVTGHGAMESRTTRNDTWIFLTDLIKRGEEPLIPLSDVSGYCSDDTRDAEDALGISPCVYLFAGRACPDFGGLALAFEILENGSTTGMVHPFDTDGLFAGIIKGNFEDRVGFAKDSALEWTTWRDGFAEFLSAYFLEIHEYWDKNPPYFEDPERVYRMNTDWRAWTFELKVHSPISVYEATRWIANQTVLGKLLEFADDVPKGPQEDRFKEFMNRRIPVNHQFYDYVHIIEHWVKHFVGLTRA